MTADAVVSPATLYVVATPLGHLGDLSPRAVSVLRAVDAVLCEDTRTSGALFRHLGFQPPLVAVHDHNERERLPAVLERLRSGAALALISDAGTPLIADPGFALVRAVREAGFEVVTVPGPSAVIAALSIAGLPTDRFRFVGFLPAKAAARRAELEALARCPDTWVCYESPHRIEACLDDLVDVLGPERPVCLARELTKRFEQSLLRPVGALRQWLGEDPHRRKGEFVLVVAGAPEAAAKGDEAETDRVLRLLLSELAPSRAARLAAEITGAPRKALYERALALGGEASAG